MTIYATLGAFQSVAPSASLNNVVARMENEKLVLLRGTYERGGQTARAWMLGTLFTSKDDGTLIAVVANDPFTGEQVEIDPVTKMVRAIRDISAHELQGGRLQARSTIIFN